MLLILHSEHTLLPAEHIQLKIFHRMPCNLDAVSNENILKLDLEWKGFTWYLVVWGFYYFGGIFLWRMAIAHFTLTHYLQGICYCM